MTESETLTLDRLRAAKDSINQRLGHLYYRRGVKVQFPNTAKRIELVNERSEIDKAIGALTLGREVKNMSDFGICGKCNGALDWRKRCGVCEGMARIRRMLIGSTTHRPNRKAKPPAPAVEQPALWQSGADKSLPNGDR